MQMQSIDILNSPDKVDMVNDSPLIRKEIFKDHKGTIITTGNHPIN